MNPHPTPDPAQHPTEHAAAGPTPVSVGREVLLAANDDAADYYRDQLRAAANAAPRRYLITRGFDALLDPATPWTVGYAPPGWTNVVDHLAALGYTDQTLLQAGLATRSSRGHLIDRFRDRITFGIRNLNGELLGLTARCSPTAGPSVPKYLNTPTTTLYQKNETLFGLAETAAGLQDGATLVLVEGPLDAIAIASLNTNQNPRYAPAALCGTAFTDDHARLITQLSSASITVAVDHDDAGVRAAENIYLRLVRCVDTLHTPTGPERSDPADLLQTAGRAALRTHLEHTRPLAEAIIDRHLETWSDLHNNAEIDLAALRELAHLFGPAEHRNMASLASYLANAIDLETDTVTRELAEATAPSAPSATAACTRIVNRTTPTRRARRCHQ